MNNSQPSPGTFRQESEELHLRHSLSRPGPARLGGLAIVLGGTILLGCSGKSPNNGHDKAEAKAVAPAVVQVSIGNLQFSPLTIEARKGDVIEWKNEDMVPHTATSASFDSGSILSGQSWRHTFMDAGQVTYACTFHPQMKGTVIIK